MVFNFLMFDQYETLDLFGPVEVLGEIPGAVLEYYSVDGGPITSRQNVVSVTKPLGMAAPTGILVVPGGLGTRTLVDSPEFIAALKIAAEQAEFVLTICTGSALLAKTGLLDGKKATSNKNAFQWVIDIAPGPDWQPKARWVKDGKYYTSSGISAGIDMALGFVADQFGMDDAERFAKQIEYIWNKDATVDPFAK